MHGRDRDSRYSDGLVYDPDRGGRRQVRDETQAGGRRRRQPEGVAVLGVVGVFARAMM